MLESDGMANVITGTGNETEKPKLCADNQTGGFADFLADIYITLLKIQEVKNVDRCHQWLHQRIPLCDGRQMKKKSFADCHSQTVSLHTCDICIL